MIVSKQPVTLYLPESKKPRTPGIHNSSIIRCIATEAGILKPEWCEELSLVDYRIVTDQKAILRMSIGLAWEEYYIPQLPDVEDHPDEICFEGVYMSMDGKSLASMWRNQVAGYTGKDPLKYENEPSLSSIFTHPSQMRRVWPIVHEVKATYKSTNTVGNLDDDVIKRRKNWMWIAQLMAYCIALKTYYARLYVLFLCGDYKRPIEPQLWQFDIEFDDVELINNWQYQKEYLANLQDRLAIGDM